MFCIRYRNTCEVWENLETRVLVTRVVKRHIIRWSTCDTEGHWHERALQKSIEKWLPKILIHALTVHRRDRKNGHDSRCSKYCFFSSFYQGTLVPLVFRITRRSANYMAFHSPCYKRPSEAPSSSLTSTCVSIIICLYFIIIITKAAFTHCDQLDRFRILVRVIHVRR